MKKITLSLLTLIMTFMLALGLVGCSGGTGNGDGSDVNPGSRGTLTIADVYVSQGKTAEINAVFSYAVEDLTYTFEGDLISISQDEVSGLKLGEVEVSAKSENYQTTFKVFVVESAFFVSDVTIEKGYFTMLDVTFDYPELAQDLTYKMENGQSLSGITIENGIVTANCEAGEYKIEASTSSAKCVFNLTVKNSPTLSVFGSTLNKRISTMSDAIETQNTTLFVGDSYLDPSFFGDYFEGRYGGLNAHVLGVSSTQAEHWYWLAQKIKVQPENLVVNVGYNDLFARVASDECINRIRSALEMFHYLMPETQIYWVTAQIRMSDDHDQTIDEINGRVMLVNQTLTEWATNRDWLRVADATTAISADLQNCLLSDGIHPNTLGYDHICDALESAGLQVFGYDNLQLQIANVDALYPGYFTAITAKMGSLSGTTYSYDETALKIENDRVYAYETTKVGLYKVNYVDAKGNAGSFNVRVESIYFLSTHVGDEGDDYAHRLKTTLTTLETNNYNHDELVIFGGDSFMDERWFFTDFYTRFAGKNAHLMGISGSRASQWIWYGQKLYQYQPKAIVLNVGTNDIFDGNGSTETVTSTLKRLFEEYHENMPNTTIYWYTVIARIGANDATGNAKAVTVNANVKEYAKDKDWLVCLDAYPVFATDTSLFKEGDTVHPACPAGYDAMMKLATDAGLTISTKQ